MISKLYVHHPQLDKVGLFTRKTNGGKIVYFPVHFSLDCLTDRHLLIRTSANDDLSFCRYFPVALLLEMQPHELPYYCVQPYAKVQEAVRNSKVATKKRFFGSFRNYLIKVLS